MIHILIAALVATCPAGHLHQARALRVIDGDTLAAVVELDLDLRQEASVRLYGVDTPELHARTVGERARAAEAKAFVSRRVGEAASDLLVCTHGKDSFGRVLADVELGGSDLAAELLAAGLAVRFRP